MMLKNVIIMMLGAVEPTSLHILVLMKDIITFNDVEERQYHYDGIEQREERIMLSFIIT